MVRSEYILVLPQWSRAQCSSMALLRTPIEGGWPPTAGVCGSPHIRLLRQPGGFEGFVLVLIEADRDRLVLAERPKLSAMRHDLGPTAPASCSNAAHSHHLIASIDDL